MGKTGKLHHRQVEDAIPWWEDTLKGKGSDFDTPDPNEGEFMSAAGYFGLLQGRLPNVQYHVPEGALKDLYQEIGAIDNLMQWIDAWEKVGWSDELHGDQNDTPRAVLNHIRYEHSDLFRQYEAAWISEHLGVTYSFVLLAMHQRREGTGNEIEGRPEPNFSDRMDTIKFFVDVLTPSHPTLISNIHNNVIPTYLLRDKPVKPKPVEPKPVEPKPVEKKEEEKGGSSSSSLWFIVILVMAIILMNSYER